MAIFISYKSEDVAYVKTLAEQLEAAGVAVWYDREMRPGQFWDDEIQTNIVNADAVLCILSVRSIQSRHVLGEVEFAERNKKHIVPLVIDGLKEHEIPPWILARSYIDARNDRDPLPELRRAFSGGTPANQMTPAAPTTPRAARAGVLTDQNARLLVVPCGGRIAAVGVAMSRHTAAGASVGLLTSFPADDVRQSREAVHILHLDEVPENTVAIADDLARRLGLERCDQDPWELTLTGLNHFTAEEIHLEVTVDTKLDEAVGQLERQGDLAGRLLLSEATSVEAAGQTYRVLDVSPPAARDSDVIELAPETRLRLFSPGVKSGVDMVILADCSGSMSLEDVTDTSDVTPTKSWFSRTTGRRTQTRMKALQQALMELLDTRLNVDGRVSRIAVFGFTRECKVRFPREGATMKEIDGSSPPQVKQDFRDAIGLLRAEKAGTDIGQALHFAAELLHRHGVPENDRLVVLISDGATWTPKGDEATGEVVSGIDDPVSLMDHLHHSMQIHLHAIGVSKEEIFQPWWQSNYAGQVPHISMIPNHQLLDQLIEVGGGDPSRTGDTQVLADYFSGLGSGVTRQTRCGSSRPVPQLQPWEREALAAARDQAEQQRELAAIRRERHRLANEILDLYVSVNEQAEQVAKQPLFKQSGFQQLPQLLQIEVCDAASCDAFIGHVHRYIVGVPDSILRRPKDYAAPAVVELLASDRVEALRRLHRSARQLCAPDGNRQVQEAANSLVGEQRYSDQEAKPWRSLQLAILDCLRDTLANIIQLYSEVKERTAAPLTPDDADAASSDEPAPSGFRFIG